MGQNQAKTDSKVRRHNCPLGLLSSLTLRAKQVLKNFHPALSAWQRRRRYQTDFGPSDAAVSLLQPQIYGTHAQSCRQRSCSKSPAEGWRVDAGLCTVLSCARVFRLTRSLVVSACVVTSLPRASLGCSMHREAAHAPSPCRPEFCCKQCRRVMV